MITPKKGRSKLALAGIGCLVLVVCCSIMATIGSMLPKTSPDASTRTPRPTMTQRPTNTPRPGTATATVTVYISADGDGAYIRSSPDREAKVKVWPDGTAMLLIERAPDGWAKVTAPDGYVGYIPVEYVTASKPPIRTATPAPQQPALSMAAFNAIDMGMTWEQVIAVAGQPTEELSRVSIGGYETVMYSWSGFLRSMNITFQNGRVAAKAQFGLK